MFDTVLPAAWEGIGLVFSWPNILYPIVGTLLAMYFSLLPGVSGATLMALAIPLTYTWEPLPVMLLFGAFVGGATFMGSATAILFNIPGLASNAATLLDGYPLTRQGKPKTALGCAAAASALGSTFGVLILIVLMPIMKETVLLFGPPEFLMLTLWGLTTIALLARASFLKGMMAAGSGLMLSFVGYDPRTAELRYTFGTDYLRDGISLVPVFLGLFALAEIMDLAASNRRTISGKTDLRDLSGSVWTGVRAVFTHFGLFLRSSVLGTIVGIIPGIGATVASFLAYEHAAQSDPGKDRPFGQGNIRGVLAPEAANDAKDGGALIPLLIFGIPGGTGTAMLLAAFSVHGLTPGQEMMNSQLSLVFVLIWALFLSNWLTSLLGLSLVGPLARLTTVRVHLIIPFILMTATIGAYMHRERIEDVFLAYILALIGYAMKQFQWPRIPLVIALVLGPLFENNLHLTMRLQSLGRIDFFSRPIVLILLILLILSAGWAFYRYRQHKSDQVVVP